MNIRAWFRRLKEESAMGPYEPPTTELMKCADPKWAEGWKLTDEVFKAPENLPLLKPEDVTTFGKNPATPEMEQLADTAAAEKLETDGTWTSSRVDGKGEEFPGANEAFLEAIKFTMTNPECVKRIEDRAAGAKEAYEYFLGPQQYWHFRYKGRTYSICSATNTPIELELVLEAIAEGRMPSEPDSQPVNHDLMSIGLHQNGLESNTYHRVRKETWDAISGWPKAKIDLTPKPTKKFCYLCGTYECSQPVSQSEIAQCL